MTQEKKKKIHQLYSMILTAITMLAGFCLIFACLDIYRSGIASDAAQIYTRKIVAQAFVKISVPVYACLILVIGGMVLDLALPIEKKKQKPEKNLPLILSRLQEKTDLSACDEKLRLDITKQQKLRRNLVWGSGMALALGFLLFLIYACDSSNWGSNSTPSMVSAMYVMLPCLAIPFICAVIATYWHRKSMAQEIELMRQAAAQAPKAAEKTAPKVRSNRTANIVRIAILAVGALLVILGACNEGTADILTKAVNICTECVGLG